MNKKPLIADQGGLSRSDVNKIAVSLPCIITEGLTVVHHRPVHVRITGAASMENIAWAIGTTLACASSRDQGSHSVPGRTATANSLHLLAERIEHSQDNLGVGIRTELLGNLKHVGLPLTDIWQIP